MVYWILGVTVVVLIWQFWSMNEEYMLPTVVVSLGFILLYVVFYVWWDVTRWVLLLSGTALCGAGLLLGYQRYQNRHMDRLAGQGSVGQRSASGAQQPPMLPMDINWEDQGDGVLIQITPQFDTSQLDFFVLLIVDTETGELAAGVGPYAPREDGEEFWMNASFIGSTATAFIAQGAAQLSAHGVYQLRVYARSTADSIIGVSFVDCPPIHGAFSYSFVWRPIVHLAMRVAKADGDLNKSEIAAMRTWLTEFFRIEDDEKEKLKAWMKAPLYHALQDDIAMCMQRTGEAFRYEILQLLDIVACADASMNEAERRMIRDIALGFGLSQEEWEEFHAQAEPEANEDELTAAFSVFGLGPDATWNDVRAAYREKMRMYHPDKVAAMAPEFQEVAHRKTQEINAAWDLLRRHFA